MNRKKRCEWVTADGIYREYHDQEWGIPVHDDRHLFEMLSLEGAQAGLSWITILKRRENYRKAFDNFDPLIVRTNDEVKIKALRQDKGIISNQRKIRSVITNAEAFVTVKEECGSLDKYQLQFVNGKHI